MKAAIVSLMLLACAANAQKPSPNQINYHNGPLILDTVNVYYIWYGRWSAQDAALLTTLAQNIGGSNYFAINGTYYEKTGKTQAPVSGLVSFKGSAVDSYSRGLALTNDDVFAVVTDKISAGQLPLDPNGVYFVLTSKDVAQSGPFGRFDVQYCGWHDHNKLSRQEIKYAFVGQDTNGSCLAQAVGPNGGDGTADGMASVIAHELSEATTDPLINAWYDSSGAENADKCAWNFSPVQTDTNGVMSNVTIGGLRWLIQKNWVNADSGYCAWRYPKTHVPSVTIQAPIQGTVFACTAGSFVNVAFAATAVDVIDGDLTSAVTWQFTGNFGTPWPNPTTLVFPCESGAWSWNASVWNGANEPGAAAVNFTIAAQ